MPASPLHLFSTILFAALLLPACAGGTSPDKTGDTGEPDETGETADSGGCEGTTEIPYDGVDNDCDAATPDDDLDGDGFIRSVDCDDADPTVGGDEVPYDGVDNDCDPTTLDDDLDGDGAPAATDCADDDPAVNPDAQEACNQVDDDCDGLVDAADPDMNVVPVWYADDDTDGYGDARDHLAACEAPVGYVESDTDCDDGDIDVNPGAVEVCDDLDNDCDGFVDDEDDSVTGAILYEDRDGDGHGTSAATREGCGSGDGWAAVDDDCDDGDETIHPGATEYCNDVDDNCDAVIDESTAADAPTWYRDADADGYGATAPSSRTCNAPAGYVDNASDCDDADATMHPGAADAPADGIDSNCDGASDYDGDGDGYVIDAYVAASGLPGGDCDDADGTVYPGADELCDDLDNNCDGAIDEGTPVDAPVWFADADADSYGDPDVAQVGCDQPAGYVANDDDCDDTDATVINVGCNTLGYGGHRIDKDGRYYYALYNDRGVGIMGSRDWYGSSDAASGPEGVAWSPDQTILYYNDLNGNVFALSEPFGTMSTHVGAFTLGQVGGGVVTDTAYYVGDYAFGNIYTMDLATGATSLYASLGGSACKPYFGNSAMSIDSDGTVYAASSCGIVKYAAGGSAVQLNLYSNLISAVAMDADQELYALDTSGNIVHFDKSTGAELGRIRIAVTPSTTWTLAVDGNGDFVVNYWGEQYVYSHVDGRSVTMFSASSYYPGSSGYYWYVTF